MVATETAGIIIGILSVLLMLFAISFPVITVIIVIILMVKNKKKKAEDPTVVDETPAEQANDIN